MRILVVNGPNLHRLGSREVEVYGQVTLATIEARVKAVGAELGVTVECYQSNSEGAIVDILTGVGVDQGPDGIIINPAAYTHTSVAIRDALAAAAAPAIEVHISNIHRREEFRRHSYTAPVCLGQICGLGADGYEWALRALVRHIQERTTKQGIRG